MPRRSYRIFRSAFTIPSDSVSALLDNEASVVANNQSIIYYDEANTETKTVLENAVPNNGPTHSCAIPLPISHPQLIRP